MSENNQDSIPTEIQQHQNSSGENKVENRRGAPARTQSIIMQNFWFYDKEAVKVIKVLANLGQLQFKILSGKGASELKELFTDNYSEDYQNKVKEERKKFLRNMKKFLYQLSNKLDLEGNLNYYFLNPNSKYDIEFNENKIVTLPINEKFIGILNSIVQSMKHDDVEVRQNKISEIIQEITTKKKQYSYIQKWALIKSWQMFAIQKLSIAQQMTEDYNYHQLRDDLFSITEYYKDLQKKSFAQLKNQFSVQINKNIDELIIALKQCFEKQ